VKTPGEETAAGTGALPAPERSNILIVDDRLDKRVVFRTILEELDQNIVTASSGEEALRWLLDNDCAVILLDVNMPGMDGFELAAMIRERPRSSRTPIIFVTAINKVQRYVYQGYETGAVDYLFKPFDPGILRSKVAVFVDLHRTIDDQNKHLDDEVTQIDAVVKGTTTALVLHGADGATVNAGDQASLSRKVTVGAGPHTISFGAGVDGLVPLYPVLRGRQIGLFGIHRGDGFLVRCLC